MATAASYSYSYAGALDAAWADVNSAADVNAVEQSGHDGCSGVTAVLDRADQSGFSLTITAQPWQPKLVMQLTLPPPGAALETISHASLHAAHATGVSLIAAESPGISLASHIGAQLHFKGEWRGATAHCAEACIAAAVALVSGGMHDHMSHAEGGGGSGGGGHGHEHGGGGGVLVWRVSPAVWTPEALVTLHTAEAVRLLRVTHATLVQSGRQQLHHMVQLDARGPDEHGGFVVEMETLDGRPLSDVPYTSCDVINQPPSAPPRPAAAAADAAKDGRLSAKALDFKKLETMAATNNMTAVQLLEHVKSQMSTKEAGEAGSVDGGHGRERGEGGAAHGGGSGGGGHDGHGGGGGAGHGHGHSDGHSDGHSNGGPALDGSSRPSSNGAPPSLSPIVNHAGGEPTSALFGVLLILILMGGALLRWARAGARGARGGGVHARISTDDEADDI